MVLVRVELVVFRSIGGIVFVRGSLVGRRSTFVYRD